MTPILNVITKYCDIYVDDINLKELSAEDKALYARRMWQYLLPSIALFNIPGEMQHYLVGSPSQKKLVEPKYDSYTYQVNQDMDIPFYISCGADYKDYEICSVRIETYDAVGNIIMVNIDEIAEYNENTGDIAIFSSEENPIKKGTIFSIDFYKDGYFVENLSGIVMNILGMCFQVTWQDRFNTDWLSMVSKVEDKSFYEQNRANKMKADTERLQMLRNKLYTEMRTFEQNCYYSSVVGRKVGIV